MDTGRHLKRSRGEAGMTTSISNHPAFANEQPGRDGETVGEIRTRARSNAKQMLEAYWKGDLPVDPVALSRAVGTDVFEAQLGTDTFGMIIGSASGADIYLDIDQAETRKRFTCAHELGHFVDHSIRGDVMGKGQGYLDRRSEEGRGTAEEIYANEFAASLLMPEAKVREFAASGFNIFDLAKFFSVSVSAMSWRLKHLGITLLNG